MRVHGEPTSAQWRCGVRLRGYKQSARCAGTRGAQGRRQAWGQRHTKTRQRSALALAMAAPNREAPGLVEFNPGLVQVQGYFPGLTAGSSARARMCPLMHGDIGMGAVFPAWGVGKK